jgi:hypothetical protein
MLTPTVTELPRRLEPTTADAFIEVHVRPSLAAPQPKPPVLRRAA